MPYDEGLAARISDFLREEETRFEEKSMFGGVSFMVDEKMCVGVIKDELLVRVDPDRVDEYLKRPGARPMEFTGRPMRGFVQVSPDGVEADADFGYWLHEALAFNPRAKSSKKRAAP